MDHRISEVHRIAAVSSALLLASCQQPVDRAAECANFKIARDRILREHLQSTPPSRPLSVTERLMWDQENLELLRPQLDNAEGPYKKRLGTDDVKTFCEATEGTKFYSFFSF